MPLYYCSMPHNPEKVQWHSLPKSTQCSIFSRDDIPKYSPSVCVLCSHCMQGHCLAVQQQCSQPGACTGAKRVCWHTIKKRLSQIHTRCIQAQKTPQAHKDTDTTIHTRAALRSWSIHDKSKSPLDVRQSNQRSWCSYRKSQEPGGDKQWCESSTTTEWPHQPRVMGMVERSYMSMNCFCACIYMYSGLYF